MHPFAALFVSLLAAGLALRLWLLWRQARAVRAHRDRVPQPFAASVTAEQHARAADYTVAHARHGALQLVAAAIVLLVLTIGGGIAVIDAAVARTGLGGPAHGVAVIAATALALMLASLPFDLRATFGIEARFGFN